MSSDPAAYDAWYATRLGAAAHKSELALVEQLAQPRPGERALDVGCGTGIYTAWLAGRGLRVTGVDRDPAMLVAAAEKAPAAELIRADAAELPFPDETFDLTLAVTLLCFLGPQARERAVRELMRVTRPGGRVVIGELARFSLWTAQRRLKGWRGSRTWKTAHFTTAGELRRLFVRAGASSIETRHGLYLPPWPHSPFVGRAETFERLGRPLGALGAAFVVAAAERAALRHLMPDAADDGEARRPAAP